MANNRLWLVHRPSGRAVKLGKRMGWGWYDPATKESIKELFEWIENHESNQDDFVLAIEDGEDAPSCCTNWKYGEKDGLGIRIITIKP